MRVVVVNVVVGVVVITGAEQIEKLRQRLVAKAYVQFGEPAAQCFTAVWIQ